MDVLKYTSTWNGKISCIMELRISIMTNPNTNPDYCKDAEKTALVRLCGVLGVLTENNDLATAALLAATRIERLEKKIPALNVDLAEASMHAYNGEIARMKLEAELARRDASLLTEGEQKEILSYIRGNYDRDKIPCWLLDLIDGVARRDEIIKRLKEDAERLASTYVIEVFPHEWVCRGGCHHWARFGEQIEHSPDCPITLHRALMKELAEC
jgi:type I site-specific restriction-modification system R (restriction) subunit